MDAGFLGRMNRAIQTLENALHKSDILPRALGPDSTNEVVDETLISPLLLPPPPPSSKKMNVAAREVMDAVHTDFVAESAERNGTKQSNHTKKGKGNVFVSSKTNIVLSVMVLLVVMVVDAVSVIGICLHKRERSANIRARKGSVVNKIDLNLADGTNPYVCKDLGTGNTVTIDLHESTTKIMSTKLNVDGIQVDETNSKEMDSDLVGAAWQ